MTIFEFTYTYQVILPLMAACIPAVLVVKLFHGMSIYETKLLSQGITISRGHAANRLREMLVRDFMTRDFETVTTDTPITEIAAMMEKSHYPHFVVLDSNGNLAGMVTLRDMRGLMNSHRTEDENSMKEIGMQNLTAQDIMTENPVTVRERDNLETAFHLFARHHISSLPVVDDFAHLKIKGILKKTDLISIYDQQVLKAGAI